MYINAVSLRDTVNYNFHLMMYGQSKSKIILSQGVVSRPVLENFKRKPEIFLCTAASETERERP